MRLREVMQVAQARSILAGLDSDVEVRSCFAADLMSDALRYDLEQALLISGLVNPQVVRTAEMADVAAVLMARGKVPTPESVQLAEELGIPLLGTDITMYETCGRLYAAGLPSCALHSGQE